MLAEDRDLLARLRAGCVKTAPNVTYTAPAKQLLDVYRDVVVGAQASWAGSPA